jgi:hypothetical protein
MLIVFGSGIAEAQKTSHEPIFVTGENSSPCEMNRFYLDDLINRARESGARIFVIARLGKGETSRYLIHRRLYNARTYFVRNWDFPAEKVVIAEGERTSEQGRVEFYLGDKLILKALLRRGGDLCVDCCEALEHFYGWGKKDSRKRQRQLESATPQPGKAFKPTQQ